MTARILHGKVIADSILDSVNSRAAEAQIQGVLPQLVFVTVGDSAPAQMYLQRLQRLGARVGIQVTHSSVEEDVSSLELDARVTTLSNDDSVDGIVVQMPLPAHLRTADLANVIDPGKDVDGITAQSSGRLYLGLPGQRPSTALAMMEILSYAGIDPAGKTAVVLGRSSVVGHPVAEMMIQRNATVTVTHRQTRNLAEVTRRAEILLAGAGRAHLVRGDMIQSGVVIVDAGINVTPEGTVGDVAFEECLPIASAITPVPGGVGPVTNAVLLRNVIESAGRRIR